jgi:hypothetical protein
MILTYTYDTKTQAKANGIVAKPKRTIVAARPVRRKAPRKSNVDKKSSNKAKDEQFFRDVGSAYSLAQRLQGVADVVVDASLTTSSKKRQ